MHRHTASDYDMFSLSQTYADRWAGKSAADDEKRRSDCAQVANEYYDLVTPIYETGWSQSFHYCPFKPGLTIKQSLQALEEDTADMIGLRAGMKVLDIGCGIGGPARTIAKHIGCEIVGITINAWQVERGTQLNREAGVDSQVTLVQGDFHHMPFQDCEFDAAYVFEAVCHAPDPARLFREVRRVLKPNGLFGFEDWVLTDAYDASNPMHRDIRGRIEQGNGLTRMPLVRDIKAALEASGFELEHDEDLGRLSKPGPWWYPLAGDLYFTRDWEDWWKVFKMHWLVRKCWYGLYWCLIKVGVLPKELLGVMETMRNCAPSVVEGGKLGIFTPHWFFKTKKRGMEGLAFKGTNRGV